MRTISFLLGAGILVTGSPLCAADPVIVHEWGTFTCLQDEVGNAIGGINVDDEPVPDFVSSVALGVAPQYGSPQYRSSNLGLPPYESGKAWTAGDPRVTMRLETPVIYFYPPKDRKPESVPALDVQVDFHGGVLSQFYPYAEFSGLPLLDVPGQPELNGKIPYLDKNTGLTEKTTTSLDWKGVQLGSTEKPIETNDKVWTTPREVGAPVVQVKFSQTDTKGVAQDYTQAEHFLFYRGVGHLDSPIYSCYVRESDRIYLWPTARDRDTHEPLPQGMITPTDDYPKGWLVEIHTRGTCAFRAMPLFTEDSAERLHPLADMRSAFDPNEFDVDNIAQLKASMQDTLVQEGLYPDEASAMLRTWELSYFKSPGLRFFYIVPRVWVDKMLPLKVTGAPTAITRVMMGRIELITDEQKSILAELAAGPCPDLAAVKKAALTALESSKLPPAEVDAFCRGEKPLSDLGISIPPLVQDYLNLGRFRDALIVHEEQLHPSPALTQFIAENRLVPVSN